MRPKLLLAISAVTFGTALAALPAFAQVTQPGAQETQPSAQAAQSSGCIRFQTNCSDTPYPMNEPARTAARQDSGAQRTGAAENRANPSNATRTQTAQSNQYPVGRAMNDGGFPAEQSQYNGAQREERTGSAENTEHAQARAAELGGAGPNYAFEPNGQGPYYNYAGGPGFMGAPMDSGAIGACEARFRSYDPNTGTYLGFDGVRHSCP